MHCAELDRDLHDILDGDHGRRARARDLDAVRGHLSHCARCRGRYGRLLGWLDRLESGRRVALPRSVAVPTHSAARSGRRMLRRITGPSVAAAALVIAVATLLGRRHPAATAPASEPAVRSESAVPEPVRPRPPRTLRLERCNHSYTVHAAGAIRSEYRSIAGAGQPVRARPRREESTP